MWWNYREVHPKGEGSVQKASWRRWTAGVNPEKMVDVSQAERVL